MKHLCLAFKETTLTCQVYLFFLFLSVCHFWAR